MDELRQNVKDAQEALVAAQKVEQEARYVEHKTRLQASLDEVMAAADEDFYTKNADAAPDRPYVLPFGREYGKWDPRDVETSAFGQDWLAGMTALVCQRIDQDRSRPSRVIFTSDATAGLRDSDGIGSVFLARHDQTGAKLGVYKIVGLVIYGTEGEVARVVGDVPAGKYSQNTYK